MKNPVLNLLVLGLILVMVACNGPTTADPPPVTPPPPPSGEEAVTGVVRDANTARRLEGVTVTGAGASATTDAEGAFTLEGLPSGTVRLTFDLSGYAQSFANAEAGAQESSVLVSLKRQGRFQAYDAATEATLVETTEVGPYALILRPNTLDTADRNLQVAITPVDPTREFPALPGELTSDGMPLVPLTFAEYTILDESGNRVNLRADSEAIVELPIPIELRAHYEMGRMIHCFSYNPVTGQWQDFVEGVVTSSSVDGHTPVVRASIKHFSWYGAAPMDEDCVHLYGQVISLVDGQPLAGARVEAFPGTATYTDANGRFRVATTAGGPPPEIHAYQVTTDVDGSISGMPGAKVITFGKLADIPLVGLVRFPCSEVAALGLEPLGSGSEDDPLVIEVGYVEGIYEAFAWLMHQVNPVAALDQLQALGISVPQGALEAADAVPGSAFVLLNSVLPDESSIPVSGARVIIRWDGGEVILEEEDFIEGWYQASFDITPGERYTVDIDLGGDGSIDGSGSVFAVGNVAFTHPEDGAVLPAAGLTLSWSDSAVGVRPDYTVLYAVMAYREDSEDYTFYSGSERSFAARSQRPDREGQPLLPGPYWASLWALSGAFEDLGTGLVATNNITGFNLSGRFYSMSGGAQSEIGFELE
jgi:hypothetical protein